MFGTLLESKRARQRNIGSTITSAAFHVLIVVGAVYATAKGSEVEQEPEDVVTFTEVRPKDTPPPKPDDTPPPAAAPKALPLGVKALSVVIDIPKVIPRIDITEAVTREGDYINVGKRGGSPDGVARRIDADEGTSRFAFEVDKVARSAPGNPEPAYPSILKQTCQTGKVKVGFVIDTTGRADTTTIRLIESTNALFGAEVRKVLPRHKFIPAEIGGRSVRMHAEQVFEFTLNCKGGGPA